MHEKLHYRDEQHQHDEVIHRHLHQRIGGVPISEMAPDEHHRRTGRGGQNDAACDVLVGFGGRDEDGKDEAEESPCQQRHREGFHHPIDEQRHEQPGRTPPDVFHRGEIDLHHHRRDHEPDENGNRGVDLTAVDELDTAQASDGTGQELSQTDARGHAERHPYRQITLKRAESAT